MQSIRGRSNDVFHSYINRATQCFNVSLLKHLCTICTYGKLGFNFIQVKSSIYTVKRYSKLILSIECQQRVGTLSFNKLSSRTLWPSLNKKVHRNFFFCEINCSTGVDFRGCILYIFCLLVLKGAGRGKNFFWKLFY